LWCFSTPLTNKKKIEEKVRLSFQHCYLFWCFQKYVFGVFEILLPRNKKKLARNGLWWGVKAVGLVGSSKIKTKKRYVPAPFGGHLPDIRRFRFQFFFFGAPCPKRPRSDLANAGVGSAYQGYEGSA
jgi:hypothetical protein